MMLRRESLELVVQCLDQCLFAFRACAIRSQETFVRKIENVTFDATTARQW